jgi:hypothetical protein
VAAVATSLVAAAAGAALAALATVVVAGAAGVSAAATVAGAATSALAVAGASDRPQAAKGNRNSKASVNRRDMDLSRKNRIGKRMPPARRIETAAGGESSATAYFASAGAASAALCRPSM